MKWEMIVILLLALILLPGVSAATNPRASPTLNPIPALQTKGTLSACPTISLPSQDTDLKPILSFIFSNTDLNGRKLLTDSSGGCHLLIDPVQNTRNQQVKLEYSYYPDKTKDIFVIFQSKNAKTGVNNLDCYYDYGADGKLDAWMEIPDSNIADLTDSQKDFIESRLRDIYSQGKSIVGNGKISVDAEENSMLQQEAANAKALGGTTSTPNNYDKRTEVYFDNVKNNVYFQAGSNPKYYDYFQGQYKTNLGIMKAKFTGTTSILKLTQANPFVFIEGIAVSFANDMANLLNRITGSA